MRSEGVGGAGGGVGQRRRALRMGKVADKTALE